jgi:hypothetical protein
MLAVTCPAALSVQRPVLAPTQEIFDVIQALRIVGSAASTNCSVQGLVAGGDRPLVAISHLRHNVASVHWVIALGTDGIYRWGPPADSLAATGTNPNPALALGVGLILVGLAVLQ